MAVAVAFLLRVLGLSLTVEVGFAPLSPLLLLLRFRAVKVEVEVDAAGVEVIGNISLFFPPSFFPSGFLISLCSCRQAET